MSLTKIQRFAKGQECTLQIPGVCSHDTEQTVLCHLGGGGMGAKVYDELGVHGCAACHDFIDGRMRIKAGADVKLYIFRALRVTLNRAHEAGLL